MPEVMDPLRPYAILVNSCDAYDDCWEPFFTLLERYWRPLEVPIFLNTETASFSYPGLDIRCPRVGTEASRTLSWSRRLRRTLEQIPMPVVLMLQDDYFIKGPVDVAMIDRMAALMIEEDVAHISLERGGTRTPPAEADREYLIPLGQRIEYRISTQACLWSVNALLSYLRDHESIWEFEWYGTRRAWRKPHRFLRVSDRYESDHGHTVVPYDPTGIVHGRWVRHVVEELFAAHGLSVPFERRGFLDPDHDDWHPNSRARRVYLRIRSRR